jgi:hypothetical protein
VFYWIDRATALCGAGSRESGVVFEGMHASFTGCGAVVASNTRAAAKRSLAYKHSNIQKTNKKLNI